MGPAEFDPGPIEDLVDFYSRWPELRPKVTQMLNSDVLNRDEKQILEWMTLLIDRLGSADLEKGDPIQ